MSPSRKYGRTYHYPFSPGTSNDDRINPDYWLALAGIPEVVHTEKLDGENTCLNKYGIFARSHISPTVHPWAEHLKEKWSWIKNDLGNLEIFGENLYAVHSIEYPKLEAHFFVFGIREGVHWLSWEEVSFYAALLDFPIVPVLNTTKPAEEKAYRQLIRKIAGQPGTFGSVDSSTGEHCTMEGIVTRSASGYPVDQLRSNVFKYVRANHVKTDEHWSRRWRRAPLLREQHRDLF